jgi:NADPH-dependent 2,4-dienoyl-CoA reductase/sulfur reductase-like enzyme
MVTQSRAPPCDQNTQSRAPPCDPNTQSRAPPCDQNTQSRAPPCDPAGPVRWTLSSPVVAEPIVIVGASLAGLRTAESLRQHGYEGPITLIGDETHAPYDRPPLSKQVLTGAKEPDSTTLAVPADLDATWMLGTSATGLDLDARRVRTTAGDVAFAQLVIATGAAPRILPAFRPAPGVHYLRTLDDALALRADLLSSERGLVVIGAGFIGLEVAVSAMSLDVATVVVEALPIPLDRAVGPEIGGRLGEWHRAKGVDLRTGTQPTALRAAGGGRPEGVELADGEFIEADVVAVGVGVSPNTGWLDGSGVDVGDGVRCDRFLRVLAGGRPRPGVFAAGDVARWWHEGYGEEVRVEHWTNAGEGADAAAANLLAEIAGHPLHAFTPVPYFWSDQHGVKLQFVGRPGPGDETAVLEGSFEEDRVLVGYGRSSRLVGALGIRRPARVMALQRDIAAGAAWPLDAAMS